jgi:hypothetical protein
MPGYLPCAYAPWSAMILQRNYQWHNRVQILLYDEKILMKHSNNSIWKTVLLIKIFIYCLPSVSEKTLIYPFSTMKSPSVTSPSRIIWEHFKALISLLLLIPFLRPWSAFRACIRLVLAHVLYLFCEREGWRLSDRCGWGFFNWECCSRVDRAHMYFRGLHEQN